MASLVVPLTVPKTAAAVPAVNPGNESQSGTADITTGYVSLKAHDAMSGTVPANAFNRPCSQQVTWQLSYSCHAERHHKAATQASQGKADAIICLSHRQHDSSAMHGGLSHVNKGDSTAAGDGTPVTCRLRAQPNYFVATPEQGSCDEPGCCPPLTCQAVNVHAHHTHDQEGICQDEEAPCNVFVPQGSSQALPLRPCRSGLLLLI